MVVENDANAAAWAEFQFGAGEDVDDLVMFTVGTGIGGGIVLDGELFRGAFGVAGELGHLRVVPGGQLCGCGNRGLLGAVRQRHRRWCATPAPRRPGSMLAAAPDRAGRRVEAIDGPLVTEAARRATRSRSAAGHARALARGGPRLAGRRARSRRSS